MIIFKDQFAVGIIKLKRFVNKNTETSVKIDLAIMNLKKKMEKAKIAMKEINVHGAKIDLQMGNELKTALQLGKLKSLTDVDGNHGGKLIAGKSYKLLSLFNDSDSKYFRLAEDSLGWNRNLFTISTHNKNTMRYKSLFTLYTSYESRTEKLEKMIKTIKDSIISLENDKQYVMTIEALIDIAKFDSEVSANIDNIKAEIAGIEKQLAMEERLNGEGEEVVPAENNVA